MPFDKKVINAYYNLREENYDEFQSLCQNPNYKTILERLTEGCVSWKCNQSGKIRLFPSKGLLYLEKMWDHFIIVKIIPNNNIF